MNQNREGVEERKKKERITTFCVNLWREKATQQNTQIYWFSSLEKKFFSTRQQEGKHYKTIQ